MRHTPPVTHLRLPLPTIAALLTLAVSIWALAAVGAVTVIGWIMEVFA